MFAKDQTNIYNKRHVLGERLFKWISYIFSFSIILLLLGIIILIIIESMPAISKFGFDFIVSSKWSSSKEEFGALAPIYGSIVGGFLAMFISIPVSIGIAIYLSQIANAKLKSIIGIGIELLAAIPSIVYGMVGLIFLVPIVGDLFGDGIGVGILSASIVLSIMVLPFMAALMRDSIETTPDILKESAYALGATKFEVIKDILFPYARIGVIGSIILALSRVLGETMAVTFLIGGVQKIPNSLVEPTTNIPSTIAVNFGESDTILYQSSLFYLAMILLVINFIIMSCAKYFMRKKTS